MSDLAGAVVRGGAWSYAARYGAKLVTFLSTLVLARVFLSQEEFGVMGYALVAVSLVEVLAGAGIEPAVVYYGDRKGEASAGFWVALTASFFFFGLTWLAAPAVGLFFDDPRAISMTRALAVTIPIAACGKIHRALLQRRLSFRGIFAADILKALCKAVVSIALAAQGFGAWSLVFGQLAGVVVAVVVLWGSLDWRPMLRIARPPEVLRLLSFGGSIVALGVVSVVVANLPAAMVGRFLGAGALGLYTVAARLPEVLILQICSTISQVVFPFYRKLSDDAEQLQRGFLATIKHVSHVTFPIGVGMFLVAEPLILVVFGERWRGAVPALQGLAVISLLDSIAFNAGDVYKAQGRPQLQVYIALFELSVLVPAMYLAGRFGGTLAAIVWTTAGVSVLATFSELLVASRLIGTRMVRILLTLLPSATSALAMAAAVLASQRVFAQLEPVGLLTLGVGTGAVVYAVVLYSLDGPAIRTAISAVGAAFSRAS